MTLLREADDLHTLVWTTHHIVSDGWCIGLVFNALLEAYDACRAGTEPAAHPAPSYSRYLEWLARYDSAGSIAYWKEYLEGYGATASLPQKKEGRKEEGEQRNRSLHLPAELIDRLNALAALRHITLNTLLRAAWSVVLAACAGTEDVLYGAVVSGRPAEIPDVESMVGLFINTVPVRFRATREKAFIALARKAADDALRSAPRHHTPLTEIHSLTPLREKLFDHILVFENYPLDREIGEGLKNRDDFSIESVAFRGDESFDLVLTAMPEYEREILFTYNSARYDDATVRNAAGMLERILRLAVADPEKPVGEMIAEATPKEEEKNEKKKPLRPLGSLKEVRATKVSL